MSSNLLFRNKSKYKRGPRIKLPGIIRPYRGLTEKEVEEFKNGIFGVSRYRVNAEWRNDIEEKSKWIPKIWE